MEKSRSKNFVKYAIPSALTTLMLGLYTTVDAIFVGKGVGQDALAAVNIINPVVTLLTGMIVLISAGGATLISKHFGAKEIDKAKSYAKQTLSISIVVSIILMIFSIVFSRAIVKNLGGTENIQHFTRVYLVTYMGFFVFNAIHITLGYLIRVDGDPILAMFATIVSGLSNIILDYIFIMVLKQGVFGAAFATGLSQVIALLILLAHFAKKKGRLSLGLEKLHLTRVKSLAKIGLPVFMAEATYAFYAIFTNLAVDKVQGDTGLAAFSIINIVGGIMNWIVFGLSNGILPLVSYAYGKKDFEEAYYYVKTCIKVSIGCSLVFAFGAFFMQNYLFGFFTADKAVQAFAKSGLLLTLLAQVVLGVNLTISTYYQASEQSNTSNLISVLRILIIYPIILFSLSYIFKDQGIYVSLLISEIIALLIILKTWPIKENKNMPELIQ